MGKGKRDRGKGSGKGKRKKRDRGRGKGPGRAERGGAGQPPARLRQGAEGRDAGRACEEEPHPLLLPRRSSNGGSWRTSISARRSSRWRCTIRAGESRAVPSRAGLSVVVVFRGEGSSLPAGGCSFFSRALELLSPLCASLLSPPSGIFFLPSSSAPSERPPQSRWELGAPFRAHTALDVNIQQFDGQEWHRTRGRLDESPSVCSTRSFVGCFFLYFRDLTWERAS